MSNDSRKNASGNPDQSSTGAPRPLAKSSRPSVGGKRSHVAKLGSQQSQAEGGGTGKALAHPLPAGAKARCFLWEAAAQAVRVVGTAQAPRFVAQDIGAILQIENIRDTIAKMLDEDERGVDTVYTLGGDQEMLTVTESGLYALIFRSRKEQARLFRKWVTSEVLPAIRKTGGYQPATMPVYALPERASFAPHIIEIVHKHPKPRPVGTGETLVCGLLCKLLNYYETFNARMMVHPHTLVDIARRDGQFAPWLAAADKKHEAIKFIQNLRPYFDRELRFAKGDNTYFTLRPQGSGSGRIYIITRREGIGLPRSGSQSGDQAIAIVAAALDAGEKVQVVS